LKEVRRTGKKRRSYYEIKLRKWMVKHTIREDQEVHKNQSALAVIIFIKTHLAITELCIYYEKPHANLQFTPFKTQ
jgi:hypothetical protein